ncbi:alpha/beta hydrolase [Sphingomonas humi]|uniref:Alpha/beta hydrolase n=1 Tax=Sphingomonas humi TaxID=335630 RepID=A0ABP7RZQ7_9SPHN
MRLAVLAAALLLGGAAPAPRPAEVASPVTLGQGYRLQSTVLGEERRINVVLPPGYAKDPKRRYPVLYLIDGGVDQDLLHIAGVAQLGAIWGRSQPVILVGIETRDRRKELVGPTRDPELLKRYPTAGHSADFREFIAREVKPLVARHYRTSGRDAVIGESLAGLFITETYLIAPTLFGAYAAIDPSLWWDKEALSLRARALLSGAQKGRPFYLAIASEQAGEPAAAERVLAAMRAAGATVCEQRRPDLTHATIYQQVAPTALQYVLPPQSAPGAEYGFTVRCAGAVD